MWYVPRPMRDSSPPLPLRRFLITIALTALTASGLAYFAQVFSTDALHWIRGSENLGACVGSFIGLGDPSGACADLSKWPLLNTALAWAWGGDAGAQLSLWHALSAGAFAAYLALVLAVAPWRSGLEVTWAAAALLSSPLLFYANSTFTEVFQGLVISAALVAWWKRCPVVAGAFAFVSAIAKDSIAPFWALFGLALVARRFRESAGSDRSAGGRLAAAVFHPDHRSLGYGITAGTALAAAFNFAKYGGPTNSVYLAEAAVFAPGWSERAENLAATLVSPNGGVLWAYGLVGVVLVVRWLRHGSSVRPFRFAAPALSLVVSGLLTTAAWWAAFGWDSWGHRLAVPYVMPLVLIGLASRGSEPERPVSRPWRWGLVAAAILAAVYAYSTLDVVFTPGSPVLSQSLWGTESCRQMMDAPFAIEDAYWDCARSRFWDAGFLEASLGRFGIRDLALAGIAVCAAALGFVGRRKSA